MKDENTEQIEGQVVEALPNATFRVQIEGDKLLLCHLSGKMRINRIRVLPGDRVRIQTTPYDDSKGRITYRIK